MRDYKLILNLVTNEKPGDKIFKQYDTGNEIELELYQNEHLNVDEKLVLTNESVLAFFKRQDGQVLQKNCSIRNGNVIVTTSKDVLGVPGILELECLVKKGDVETTTTRMTFTVQESIARDGAIEEDPRYTSDLVTELLDVRDNVKAETIGKIEEVASDLEETKNEVGTKVTKVEGKGLSTNDYTNEDKTEVLSIKGKATKQELAVERSRIDQFTRLAEGSTTGDSELIDARVGANGVTYSNIGNAIREQVGNNNNLIMDSNNGYTHFPRNIFHKGGLNDAGEFVEVNYRIGTKDKIFADRDMYVIAKDGYKLAIHFYDNEGVLTFITGYHYSCFIAKGSYFNISIQTEPDSWGDLSEEDIQEYINSVDVTSKEYMQLLNNINENNFLSFDKFVHKSQTNGKPIQSKDARLLLKEITLADKDITLTINKGFKFSVQHYDETDTFINETPWIKNGEYTINKGSRFRILIGDDKEKLTDGTYEGNKTMDYIIYRSLMNNYSCISNVYKELESIKKNNETYNYSYKGEKINTKRHGMNCKRVKKFSWDSFASELSNTGFQGIAEQNNIVVSAHTSNYVSLHDFNTCEVIAHFVAPQGGHGNSCGFLDKKYNAFDEFNIFWITPNTSSSPSICFYRLTRESATLLKKITFDLEDCGYYADFCVDYDKMLLYGIGYSVDSYSVPDGNPMKCTVFDISNQPLTGGDTVHLATPLKSFTLPFITTGQGKVYFNGKMYAISSKNTGTANTIVYGIDYDKERIVTILDEFSNGVKTQETEGMFFKLNQQGDYDIYIMDIYGETYKIELG